MNRLAAAAFTLALVATPAHAQTDAVAARIDRILREVPLIDGHNDLPYQYEERVKDHLAQIDIRQDQSKLTPPLHTDLARLRQGRLGAQFWSVYIPTTLKGADAVRVVIDQIDVVHRIDELYPDTFELARYRRPNRMHHLSALRIASHPKRTVTRHHLCRPDQPKRMHQAPAELLPPGP